MPTDLFPETVPAVQDVHIEDQILCVQRELAMRRRVYPGWVAKGRMTQESADLEIQRMQAVLATLRQLWADLRETSGVG